MRREWAGKERQLLAAAAAAADVNCRLTLTFEGACRRRRRQGPVTLRNPLAAEKSISPKPLGAGATGSCARGGARRKSRKWRRGGCRRGCGPFLLQARACAQDRLGRRGRAAAVCLRGARLRTQQVAAAAIVVVASSRAHKLARNAAHSTREFARAHRRLARSRRRRPQWLGSA